MNHIALTLTEILAIPWVRWALKVALLVCLPRLLGIVYIPHTQVGIIEKIWSSKGSLREGQIIARSGEAGFQSHFLRGGIHFGLYPWQYRIHKETLDRKSTRLNSSHSSISYAVFCLKKKKKKK